MGRPHKCPCVNLNPEVDERGRGGDRVVTYSSGWRDKVIQSVVEDGAFKT